MSLKRSKAWRPKCARARTNNVERRPELANKADAQARSPHKRPVMLLVRLPALCCPISSARCCMQGHPPLHWAALNNHQTELQFLLAVRLPLTYLGQSHISSKLPDLLSPPTASRIPVRCAALLQKGAKIHATNPEGATALHWAVVRNSLPCLETLLRSGASKDSKDLKGYQARASRFALQHACSLPRVATRAHLMLLLCNDGVPAVPQASRCPWPKLRPREIRASRAACPPGGAVRPHVCALPPCTAMECGL
jgi:Ankyrin repeat